MELIRAIVTIEGGGVQWVEVPQGVIVEIRDYDIDSHDPEFAEIEEDANGDSYAKQEWSADECNT